MALKEIITTLFMIFLALCEYIMLASPWFLLIYFIIRSNKKKNEEYMNTAYYRSTQIPFKQLRYDAGKYGEYLIYKELQWLEQYGARFLFNAYIPQKNGKTSEIDIIMICDKGVFVYESKNYSGWIFGSEKQKDWYQTLYSGKGNVHKETFYNPIIQNRSHIKHLSNLFPNKISFQSIIVFSNDCTLKNINIDSEDISVVQRYELNNTIKRICQTLPTVFSQEDIKNIYDSLFPLTQVNAEVVEKHIAETAETIKKFENAKETMSCPYCGSQLVVRTTKNNPANRFYGCSRFPKCRYTRKF